MKQKLLMLLLACCIGIIGMAQQKDSIPPSKIKKLLNKADTILKKVDEKVNSLIIPPRNLTPADGHVLTEKESKVPIAFSWTQVSPLPKGGVTYRFRLFEVRKGQNPAEAAKTNKVLEEKTVSNETSLTCCVNPIIVWPIAAGSKYGWNIEVMNTQGQMIAGSLPAVFLANEVSIPKDPKPVENSGGYITELPITKISCIQVLSPHNGSQLNTNQLVRVSIKTTEPAGAAPEITLYKISNEKNYWNQERNRSELLNTDNTMYLSMPMEEHTKNTGFQPVKLQSKVRNGIVETDLSNIKLTEGAYKLVVIGKCGVTTSNFSATSAACGSNDANVRVECKGWQNGKPKYKVFVTFFNIIPASGGQQCTTVMNGITSSTGAITTLSTLPATIPIGGNAPTVSFDYIPATTGTLSAAFYFTGIWNDGNNNTSNFNQTVDLPSCVCDYCETKPIQEGPSTVQLHNTITGYNVLNVQQTLTPPTSSNIVGGKAEILGFARLVNDDCMPCNKDGNRWANFVTGAMGNTAGTFNLANNGVTGNTRHSIYFTGYTGSNFNLNIVLPPLTTLNCCCDIVVIWIRYTYIFKDVNGECRFCSTIQSYLHSKNPNSCNLLQLKSADGNSIQQMPKEVQEMLNKSNK